MAKKATSRKPKSRRKSSPITAAYRKEMNSYAAARELLFNRFKEEAKRGCQADPVSRLDKIDPALRAWACRIYSELPGHMDSNLAVLALTRNFVLYGQFDDPVVQKTGRAAR